MSKHKDQRVGVFVDVQNMYYSAKQFYHAKVNFAHILNRAVAGRNLIRAIAYVIKADIKEEENFFEALEKIGYDVRSKDLQVFFGGAKKGDWDVGIAMDIMRMANKLDVVVLVSGDGDFKDLLEHVKSLGCRAEVIAFRKTASSRILSEADEFVDLDKELQRLLIKDYSRKNYETKNFENKNHPGSEFKGKFNDFKPKREFISREDKPSLVQLVNLDQPSVPQIAKKPEPTKLEFPKQPEKLVETKAEVFVQKPELSDENRAKKPAIKKVVKKPKKDKK